MFRVELVDQGNCLFVVRAVKPSRLIHFSRERLSQKRAIQPRKRSAVAFHSEKHGIDISDAVVHPPIKLGLQIVGIGRNQRRLAF